MRLCMTVTSQAMASACQAIFCGVHKYIAGTALVGNANSERLATQSYCHISTTHVIEKPAKINLVDGKHNINSDMRHAHS